VYSPSQVNQKIIQILRAAFSTARFASTAAANVAGTASAAAAILHKYFDPCTIIKTHQYYQNKGKVSILEKFLL
jgi:hypothetical protein